MYLFKVLFRVNTIFIASVSQLALLNNTSKYKHLFVYWRVIRSTLKIYLNDDPYSILCHKQLDCFLSFSIIYNVLFTFFFIYLFMKRIHENKKANSFISFIYFLLIVFIEIYQSLVFTDINQNRIISTFKTSLHFQNENTK